MSFFNMAAGNNPMFGILARIVETVAPLPPVPRFRDMYTMDHDGKLVIVLYTRTGGGNRAAHSSENAAIAAHPLFRETFDDKFDNTFVNFVFEVPEQFVEALRALHDEFSRFYKGKTPQERFRITIAGMEGKEVPEEPDDSYQLELRIYDIARLVSTEMSSLEKAMMQHTTITAVIDPTEEP